MGPSPDKTQPTPIASAHHVEGKHTCPRSRSPAVGLAARCGQLYCRGRPGGAAWPRWEQSLQAKRPPRALPTRQAGTSPEFVVTALTSVAAGHRFQASASATKPAIIGPWSPESRRGSAPMIGGLFAAPSCCSPAARGRPATAITSASQRDTSARLPLARVDPRSAPRASRRDGVHRVWRRPTRHTASSAPNALRSKVTWREPGSWQQTGPWRTENPLLAQADQHAPRPAHSRRLAQPTAGAAVPSGPANRRDSCESGTLCNSTTYR